MVIEEDTPEWWEMHKKENIEQLERDLRSAQFHIDRIRARLALQEAELAVAQGLKTSKYKHVHRTKWNTWVAKVRGNPLKTYKTEEEAARAADAEIIRQEIARQITVGKFPLNFPDEWPSKEDRRKKYGTRKIPVKKQKQ